MYTTVTVSMTCALGAVFLQGCRTVVPVEDNPSSTEPETTDDTNETTTSTTTTTKLSGLWNCSTNRTLKVALPEQKGLAVDDTTWGGCIENVGIWPHSEDVPTTSLRIFPRWNDDSKREDSWNKLKDYVEETNAKVLFGVEYLQGYDDDNWYWTFELMKFIGPNNTMGVGFGNDVDLYGDEDYFARGGILINQIKRAVDHMDAAGFEDIPITTAFTTGIVGSINGTVKPFLQQAHELYGDRWVFSMNPFSIWDQTLMEAAKTGNCEQAVAKATGIGYVKNITGMFRDQIKEQIFDGKETDYKLWLTGMGWSSPAVDLVEQKQVALLCGAWGDSESLWHMYHDVMTWNLTLDDGKKAADHLFYYTLRDAPSESFGLVSVCGDNVSCKIQDQNLFV